MNLTAENIFNCTKICNSERVLNDFSDSFMTLQNIFIVNFVFLFLYIATLSLKSYPKIYAWNGPLLDLCFAFNTLWLFLSFIFHFV